MDEFHEKLDYLTGLKILIDLDENPKDPNYDPLITSKFNHLLISIGLSMTCHEDATDKYSLITGKECRILMKDYYKSQINFDLIDAIVNFDNARKELGHE